MVVLAISFSTALVFSFGASFAGGFGVFSTIVLVLFPTYISSIPEIIVPFST
jgi:hypothetical protein